MGLFGRPARELPKPPNPESAWKALAIVIDWIKHADAKAAATIAASGVLGSLLYALVKDVRPLAVAPAVTAVACAVLVGLGAAFAAWSLRPRLVAKDGRASRLYFTHVADNYAGAENYEEVFHALVGDDDRLVREVAWQVWATSRIVRRKFRWGGYGLMCVLASLPLLAATAVLVVLL